MSSRFTRYTWSSDIALRLSRWAQRGRTLWHTWTEPHPSITDPHARRRARFLASFVLAAIAINLLAFPELASLGYANAAWVVVWTTLVTGLVYVLSRTPFFNVGVAVIMAVTFCYVAAMIAIAPSAHTAVLALIPIYLSSLFYDIRRILIISCVSLLLVVLAARYVPGKWEDVPLTLIFIAGSAGLAVVSNGLLRRSEQSLYERSLQLSVSESRFRAALDGALNIFYVLRFANADQAPVVIEANRLALQHVGRTREAIIGHPPPDSLAGDQPRLLAECRRALATRCTVSGECDMPTGEHYEYMIVPFEGQAAVSLRDITERKRLEKQALDLALERQRVTLLQNFIGDASHDMLSPLTVVKTSLFLLKNSADQERREAQLTRVEAQLTRLQHMIRDMRALTDLDRLTTLELALGQVDLNVLLSEIGVTYEPLAALKDQTLCVQVSPTPLVTLADRARLEVVIANLVENAFKYTPRGSMITIHAQREGDSILIDVRDNGKGLHEKALPYLFDRFYRSEEHRAADSSTSGSGLGLSIVRRIVEAHHGSVSASNLPGGGAQFRICLPIHTSAAPPEPHPSLTDASASTLTAD